MLNSIEGHSVIVHRRQQGHRQRHCEGVRHQGTEGRGGHTMKAAYDIGYKAIFASHARS